MSDAAVFNFAALHSDNSFEIFVDQNLVNSGNLLDDMRYSCWLVGYNN